jgi:hypothetical protein
MWIGTYGSTLRMWFGDVSVENAVKRIFRLRQSCSSQVRVCLIVITIYRAWLGTISCS